MCISCIRTGIGFIAIRCFYYAQYYRYCISTIWFDIDSIDQNKRIYNTGFSIVNPISIKNSRKIHETFPFPIRYRITLILYFLLSMRISRINRTNYKIKDKNRHEVGKTKEDKEDFVKLFMTIQHNLPFWKYTSFEFYHCEIRRLKSHTAAHIAHKILLLTNKEERHAARLGIYVFILKHDNCTFSAKTQYRVQRGHKIFLSHWCASLFFPLPPPPYRNVFPSGAK